MEPNNEGHTDEFTRRMSEIHLQLYHLMLDVDTSYAQACACNVVLDSFDAAWEKLKEYEEIVAREDKENE
ncbi:hypothetical protein D3C85_293160 [compost metagenome]